MSPPSGQPACCTTSASSNDGQRSLRRGLQNQRTTGGNRGRNFVRHQIQRKIEGSDPGDRPQRKAPHDAPASSGELLPVEWQVLAVDPRALFGGNLKGKDGALDFGARGLDRLARFLASVRENSSLRCAMPSATRRSTLWRSKAGKRRVVPNAFTAAAIAASACSRLPW